MSVDLGDHLSAVYESENFQLYDNLYNEGEVDSDAHEREREEYAFYEWLDKEECDRCVSF